MVPDYYNRFSVASKIRQVLFRATRGLQSAELNEVQSILMQEINNRFFQIQKEGGLLDGGDLSIQGSTARLAAALAVTRGFSTEIPSREIDIPTVGSVVIGIGSRLAIITEREDDSLLNPAVDTVGYKQPGAARTEVHGRWALESDRAQDEYFYPIYTIEDGVLIGSNSTGNDEMSAFTEVLARYDSNANGDYVTNGMYVTYQYDNTDAGNYIVSVSHGTSHVRGYEIIFDHDRTLGVPYPINTNSITGEPFQVNNTDNKYYFRHAPAANITEVLGTVETTDDVVHGNYNGAIDPLPNTSVVRVIEVKQGQSVYVEGTDFLTQGDKLDWSLSGAEPAPGSTYQVKYQYQDTVNATISSDRKWFSLDDSHLADGTSMFVDYYYYIPRVDRIVLLYDGTLKLLQGNPAEYNALPPDYSEGLSLATVQLSYGTDPVVINDTYRAFKMSDIRAMENRMNTMESNLARLMLIEDARSSDPTTIARNLFVDPFYDDDMRDNGKEQNALVLDKRLTPNISWDNLVVAEHVNGLFLPYQEQVSIKQEARTGARLINEFAWLAGKPAELTVSPAKYQWVTETIYKDVYVWSNHNSVTTSSSQKVVATPEKYDIPLISVQVDAPGFNAGESVDIYYDSRLIATTVANSMGIISHAFTIPENSKAGSKLIRTVAHDSGVTGETVFIAEPMVRTLTTTYRRINYDPVAQTFLAERTEYISSVELMFDKAPVNSDVTVYITETTVGMPDRNRVIGQAVILEEDVNVNVWEKFSFDKPVPVEAGREYAIVVASTDVVSAVKIAKLGEYDNNSKTHVSRQAYENGVLLNSSNASTWSPIQDEDLTFRVSRAQFVAEHTFELGEVSVTDATDLMLLCEHAIPPGTSIVYTATLVDNSNEKIQMQPHIPVIIEEYTGLVKLSAVMTTSDDHLTPMIGEVIELAAGKVVLPSTYISRNFPVQGGTLKVLLDQNEPSASNVTLEYFDPTLASGAGDWVALVRDSSNARPVGNGMIETPYNVTDLTIAQTAIKITLSSNLKNIRPSTSNLRAIVS